MPRHQNNDQALSAFMQRKAEIVEDPSDKKGALFQAAGIEPDVVVAVPETGRAAGARYMFGSHNCRCH